MGYQVLARKWRPGRFADLVGQEHVVTAIANALDNDRLHHAYLFTGTRGVGKTTIARIFAKSLNCEKGQGANPCGQCHTCLEIEQGNYVDLLEIDAASRTKVEDTRELLDNVQYKPTRGRFKVYLIDEVHMLSKHSFNALLKTLEEPPPHVKFLLATTDPQKLPITILSRCLQFNLKALSREQIANQLTHILGQETVAFEAPALALLARAAQGSMRDALSLTDQAIAQGDNQVTASVVTDMLGLMDRHQLLKLLQAVVSKSPSDVMGVVDVMAEQAPDYGQVIAELSSLLHQIALTHWVPEACKLETTSAKAIYQLSKQISAEQVQVLYQICIQGKKDLPFAIDGRSALEMTLLRMMSFVPATPIKDGEALVAAIAPAPVQSTSATPAALDNGSLSQQLDVVDTPVTEDGTSSVAEHTESTAQPANNDSVIAVQEDESQTAGPAEANENESRHFHDGTEDVKAEQELHQELHAIEQEANDFRQADVPPNYDEMPPMMEQPPIDAYMDNEQVVQPAALPNASAMAGDTTLTTTQEMLALRERLKKSREEAKEDASKKQAAPQAGDAAWTPPKAPQRAEPDDANGLSNEVEPSIGDDVPPWVEESSSEINRADTLHQSEHADSSGTQNITTEMVQDVPMPSSITSGQADTSYQGELVPYLESGEKLTAAKQIDNWSHIVEQMPVAGLLKQLALNASFSQQGNDVALLLDSSQAHLLNPTTQMQLQQALQSVVGDHITMNIELGEPNVTPSKIQNEIKQMRHQYARDVVQTDDVFQQLVTNFEASVDPDSVLPR